MPPDQPSPDSVKLAESLVLVEFIGDIFPESGIVPKDPVKRAQARFFVEGVASKFVPAWFGHISRNAPVEDLYNAIEYLQSLLPADGGFVVGEYSLADISLTPFLARARVSLLNELGAFPEGEGKKIWEMITSTTGKYARFAKYVEDSLARESFKATFNEVRSLPSSLRGCVALMLALGMQELVTATFKVRFGDLREKLQKEQAK